MALDRDEYEAAGVRANDAGDPPHDVAKPSDDLPPSAASMPPEDMVNADPMLEIARRMADDLGALARAQQFPPEPLVLAKRRFRILCMEVFGHMHPEHPATRVAEVIIGGVYSGHIAYKRLREAVDRNQDLSPEDKALCLGLCAGFMVDFLPRVRG